MWFYYFCKFFAMIFYNIVYPHKVIGKENLPKDKNFILVSNHYGKIDILVISALFKRRPYFLAKKELMENKFWGKVFKHYGLIPVDRSKADIVALKQCFTVLKNGENLAIFPEGTRNKLNDDLQELKGGASLIALKAGVSVVPVMMYKRFRPFRKNYLKIGKPFDYDEFKGRKATAEVVEETEKIMKEKMISCRKELVVSIEKRKK